MAHLCGITVQAFIYRDIPKGEGYEDDDLLNAIMLCEDLLEAGHTLEPIDGFDLREFIAWATEANHR